MESRNRNTWIIVVAVLVLLCCCTIAAAAVALWAVGRTSVDWLASTQLGWDEGLAGARERIEQRFAVGESPNLKVATFAGTVTVRGGERDEIVVVATKVARSQRDLDDIELTMTESAGSLVVEAKKPGYVSNASVRLEITAPSGTRLDVDSGAGSVDLRGLNGGVSVNSGAGSVQMIDVTGRIDAATGAGSLDVRGAAGPARLTSGAGSITYEGAPSGDCWFHSGAGSITLVLPEDLHMQVDLETGAGTIDVDYDVEGQVARREVRGTIGRGDQGRIDASSGMGSIDLVRR